MTHDEWVRSELEAFSKAHGFIYTPLREIETRLGRLRKHMEELEIEAYSCSREDGLFLFFGYCSGCSPLHPLGGTIRSFW